MRLKRFDEARPSKADREDFDRGAPSLDRWLAAQARQSMDSHDAVTYLLLDDETEPERIAGYFCLAAAAVAHDDAPDAMRRRPPPGAIPAIHIGRFAIDRRYQGRGWGAELLRQALLRLLAGATLVGAGIVLVNAISDEARSFYLRFGFSPSPTHPLQLCFDLRAVAASVRIDR